jgi:hypothetical protein
MTRCELDLIRRSLELLHRLVPDVEPRAVDLTPRRRPLSLFAKRYLVRDPARDLTSAQLWEFYAEVVASGEVDPLSRPEFLRRLPAVMESLYNVRKSHNIQRSGGRVRGFKGITIREHVFPPTALELEPEPV